MHLNSETIDMSYCHTVLRSSCVQDVPNSDNETNEEDSEEYSKCNDSGLWTVDICITNAMSFSVRFSSNLFNGLDDIGDFIAELTESNSQSCISFQIVWELITSNYGSLPSSGP